jgi:hypothetical protein
MQVEIPHLVHDEHVEASQRIEQLARGPLGERCVHLVKEVLGAQKQAAIAVLQRLEQQARGKAGLADAGGPDENDVLGLGDEVELGKAANLSLRNARLALERE